MQPFLEGSSQIRAMFEAMAPYAGAPMKLLLSNLWCFGPVLVKVLPKLSAQAGAMIGTTCVPKEIQGSAKEKKCTAMVLLRPVDADDWEKDLAAVYALAKKYPAHSHCLMGGIFSIKRFVFC